MSTMAKSLRQVVTCLSITVFASDLLLRNDDLTGEGILRVGNGVVEQADAAHHLSHFADAVRCVRRVAVDLLAPGGLATRAHAHHLSVLDQNLVDWFVQHVSAAIYSTEPSEALRQFTQTIQRIEIRTFAVAGQRFAVELDPIDEVETRLLQISGSKRSESRGWRGVTHSSFR